QIHLMQPRQNANQNLAKKPKISMNFAERNRLFWHLGCNTKLSTNTFFEIRTNQNASQKKGKKKTA
ncbi:hypothetical protein, partial [Allotamlana fucoidanivorans]|uniref:hypothetical protein n=1 Tax=Allotamlana fucoidanivorans TaxID=2583814 RepID=UPI001E5641A8